MGAGLLVPTPAQARAHRRIQRSHTSSWILTLAFVLLGTVWMFFRFIACAAGDSYTCSLSFLLPVILAGAVVLALAVVLQTLFRYGVDAQPFAADATRLHKVRRAAHRVRLAHSQLPQKHQRHVKRTFVHTGVVLGGMCGVLIWFYLDTPPLVGMLLAVAMAVGAWALERFWIGRPPAPPHPAVAAMKLN